MSTRLPSLIFAAVIFALAGWMGGAIITAKGGLAGLSGTMMSIESLRAGLLAAALGAGLGAPMLWIRQRPVAIIAWVAVSGATAALAVWLYYAIWPPQWEAPAYKIAGMVLKGYWKHLIPLAIASGVLIGSLITAPEQPPEESPIG
ncbi:MAG: hypothetical protein P8R54_29735 [Myxococcota bacterium]|nr:hypothetical protein [Myxococcota bacterium]